MFTRSFKLLVIGTLLLIFKVPLFSAQASDGTVKITSRMVAPGVGLSWGEGVLSYKGQNYPFSFEAKGLFRDVDPAITAAELSGQVFHLNSIADFSGTYQKVESGISDNSGTRATMKNKKGVVVDLTSTVEGRKFNLGREGLKIEIKKK